MKVNGSYDAPWGIRLTPALRFQQGQPFGRTFLAGAANGINYGTQRILAEPLDSQRQDDIAILDIRAEKLFTWARRPRRLGVFTDIYNITNSNAAQNIGWNSGVVVSAPGQRSSARESCASARSSTGNGRGFKARGFKARGCKARGSKARGCFADPSRN